MKRVFCAVAAMALASSALAGDVGVSISVGQPGFYGRIDIGDGPRPRVLYAEPIVVEPVRSGVVRRPAYWDVSYRFRGALHHAQFSAPPGQTITVDETGRPRG